jgi:hypothetical protein
MVEALRAHVDRATADVLPQGLGPDVAPLLVALATRLGTRDDEAAALLTEALLASRRDAELAQVLATALGKRERFMAALLTAGQSAGELTGDVSAEAAARLALMLNLGSLLVRALDLPPTDPDDWGRLARRLVDAFTQETNP